MAKKEYSDIDLLGNSLKNGGKVQIGRTYHNVTSFEYSGTANEIVIKTKIPYSSSSLMPYIHIHGYAYGLSAPIELKVAFYIYGGNFVSLGAVSLGAWQPTIKLFSYLDGTTNYVALAFTSSIYYCRFSVNYQDIWQGTTRNYSEGWTVEYTTGATIVGTDNLVTVPYKSILMASDVLEKIKTVDGTGSGLDADTLDGKQAVDFSNASDSFNFDANIEPTQTGTYSKTHLWSIQYALQGLKNVYTLLKGLLSTNGRVLLGKMQNRAPYINGSSIIGSETDTVIDWRAGANITITPGTVSGGLYPITIAATGGSGGSQVQVDFNITDSADVRYILNKPIDNRTISGRISALVNKRFQVNPGTAAGSYNEGIRIGNSSQGYSLIALGCDSSTDSGLNSDNNQWHIIKYPNGTIAIIKNSSDSNAGLLLDANGFAYWKGAKILTGSTSSNTVIVLDPTIVSHHLMNQYNQLPFDQYNTNTDFAISLDETNTRYIELSIQMSKVDTSKLNFSFTAGNSGEVYFTKNIVDITTTSGTCMVHYICKYVEGNWFVSNEVFEM